MIFVGKYKSENGVISLYYCFGKANNVSHSGSRPMNIVWRLEEEMWRFGVRRLVE